MPNAIPKRLEAFLEDAILDGELCAPDHLGRRVFPDLMKRRQWARYFAFDLLWLNGEDQRTLPLVEPEAKVKTHSAVAVSPCFVGHAKGAGRRPYELACQVDLEGIVARSRTFPSMSRMRGAFDMVQRQPPVPLFRLFHGT